MLIIFSFAIYVKKTVIQLERTKLKSFVFHKQERSLIEKKIKAGYVI